MVIAQKTTRLVKNRRTGIDASVPSYERADNPRDVKFYHVLVVTNLPHPKSGEFAAEDVVQFMVPRSYEAFEKMHSEIIQYYPQFKSQLPVLPRKIVLFPTVDTVKERQKAFNALVEFIANTEKIAKCVPFFDFLEVDPTGDKTYLKLRNSWLKEQEEKKAKSDKFQADSSDLFLDNQNDEDDILADLDKEAGTGAASRRSNMPKAYHMDLEEYDLPELDTHGNLLNEEDSEILKVQDDVDDLLKISTGTKQKGVVGYKSKKSESLFDEEEEDSKFNVQSMNTDDILKYISVNQKDEDDDLNLF